jgi:hypothetical protein
MKTTFSLLFYLKKPKNYENGPVIVYRTNFFKNYLGKEQTLIFDLTDEQRQNLEKNGFLLNQPQELLKYLNS